MPEKEVRDGPEGYRLSETDEALVVAQIASSVRTWRREGIPHQPGVERETLIRLGAEVIGVKVADLRSSELDWITAQVNAVLAPDGSLAVPVRGQLSTNRLAESLRELLRRHGDTIRRALENEITSARGDAHAVQSLPGTFPFTSDDDAEMVQLVQVAERLAKAHLSRVTSASQALLDLDAIEEGL